MSKDIDMNLQFFADPNDPGSQADPNGAGQAGDPGSSGTSLSSSSSSDDNAGSSGAAKYTQDQVNKMMADKHSEVAAKVSQSLAEDNQAKLSSAVKHAVARANMTADQKRADDKRSAEAHQKQVEAELAEYKRRDAQRSAVAAAQTSLTSAGVPNAASVAAFVADSDSAVQASKTSALLNWFSGAAAGVKKAALTPDKNPNDANSRAGASFDTKDIPKDPAEMSFTQYAAMKTYEAEKQRKQ